MIKLDDDNKRCCDAVFIRKGGYFYRPEWCGYTSSPKEAGIYWRSEAEAHAADTEGVTVHELAEFSGGNMREVRKAWNGGSREAALEVARKRSEEEIASKQELPAHRVMTPEEYARLPIVDWHMVCRNFDGSGNIGIRFLGTNCECSGDCGAAPGGPMHNCPHYR